MQDAAGNELHTGDYVWTVWKGILLRKAIIVKFRGNSTANIYVRYLDSQCGKYVTGRMIIKCQDS